MNESLIEMEEGEMEPQKVSLAIRSEAAGVFMELDTAAFVVAGEIKSFPDDVKGEHMRFDEDWESIITLLQSVDIHCWYTHWSNEDQDDFPGEFFISAYGLNSAIESGKISIKEDPQAKGSFDFEVLKPVS